MTKHILSIDDDADISFILERFLTGAGYEVTTAGSVDEIRPALEKWKPDLVLLDVMLPGMSGYAFAAELSERPGFATVPIVFVTALGSAIDMNKAFAAGCAGHLTKPIKKETLLAEIQRHLKTAQKWDASRSASAPADGDFRGFDFTGFRERLAAKAKDAGALMACTPQTIFKTAAGEGWPTAQVIREAADFLDLPFAEAVDPESVQLGVLPTAFCRHNRILPVLHDGSPAFIISNPFDTENLEMARRTAATEEDRGWVLADVGQIDGLLASQEKLAQTPTAKSAVPPSSSGTTEPARSCDRKMEAPDPKKTLANWTHPESQEKLPTSSLSRAMLESAVDQGASDIHIEPKEDLVVVRFRVDGDLRDKATFNHQRSRELIASFKVNAKLDIAEHRKPQDGSFRAEVRGKAHILRVATSSTPNGESLVMRLLDLHTKPRSLPELGLMETQIEHMMEFATRHQGMLLVVGPTGSGKTTTLYSLLENVDCNARSLMSVEDPVEYRIPYANQQSVDEKAGVTFETLLKSAVRQDPDVLFLGEIRDPYSARMAVDFASTGHMTLSTMHASNATAAIFRMERLGVTRAAISDALIGIISQRLLKRLCPKCKKSSPTKDQQREVLQRFTDEVPEELFEPVGCDECSKTGYVGRESVNEIVRFSADLLEMVRNGDSIAKIRLAAKEHGDVLVSQHAVDKLRRGACAVKDVFETILAEEKEFHDSGSLARHVPPIAPAGTTVGRIIPEAAKKVKERYHGGGKSILVVDDDPDLRKILETQLSSRGFTVITAEDGVQALSHLGRESFDLILSDVDMPNMDGLKLMEIRAQFGFETPVIFITGTKDEEAEIKALQMGAADYVSKPVNLEVLMLRLQRILKP